MSHLPITPRLERKKSSQEKQSLRKEIFSHFLPQKNRPLQSYESTNRLSGFDKRHKRGGRINFVQLETEQRVGAQGCKKRKKRGEKKPPKTEQCKREALFSPVEEFMCLFVCFSEEQREANQSRAFGGIPLDKGLNHSCKDRGKKMPLKAHSGARQHQENAVASAAFPFSPDAAFPFSWAKSLSRSTGRIFEQGVKLFCEIPPWICWKCSGIKPPATNPFGWIKTYF